MRCNSVLDWLCRCWHHHEAPSMSRAIFERCTQNKDYLGLGGALAVKPQLSHCSLAFAPHGF